MEESQTNAPACDVLLIYGELDEKGRFRNSNLGLREIIRDSGAKIVVVASENPASHYIAAGKRTSYGSANLVMTLDRKGDALPTFLVGLFTAMRRGTPMPKAWAALAPQSMGAARWIARTQSLLANLGMFLSPAPARAI